ncbi:hypothetical protein SAMN05660690_2400 [Geodermatophilus telluris]|uniref:Uncharacterized protein n=1 Tax=Geodermatophilus telluris TaxID=1190417 RepID=A0A1G6P4V5_9ACTN|nr:hypothetical protein [Geodermatophilus telluris]SDC74991.1 hypothetical protein SAMN05660690_2400 [Geodermatophilus telluris]
MSTVVPFPRHRTAPDGRSDVAADLLAVAWAPGAAPPREIRVRPELYARLVAQVGPAVARLHGVPVAVDPALPDVPGFEVLRVRPGRGYAAAA